MEFLSIPAEVIDANVLPYLKWNDLLRFRRVCKAAKDVTDGYLKVYPELAPEIEINVEDKNFREFLGLTTVPPTMRLFLNNVSGTDFYFYDNAGEDGAEFLERLGPHVRHLRVNQLSESPVDMELDFLEAFVNLESFEAAKVLGYKDIVETNRNQYQPTLQDQSERSSFPMSVLRKLKALKIANDKDVVDVPNLLEFGLVLLYSSGELEAAALPFNPNTTFDANDSVLISGIEGLADYGENPMAVAFAYINGYIQKRFINSPPGTRNFKVFDFISFHHDNVVMELTASPPFLIICMSCLDFGVKLRNVGSSWFHARNLLEIAEFRSVEPELARLEPEFRKVELGTPVLSIINLHPSMFPLSMPNLEKIEIRSTSQSSPGVHWKEERPDWPCLSTLQITVDSLHGGFMEFDRTSGRVVNYRTSTKNLFKFFFEDITREALTELHLEFTNDAGRVSIPKTEDIVSSCPNLRKLTLVNWPGTNNALTKLWKGLPGLEEVSLENCKDLGNVAFVGENADCPIFLKLTKLRRLSLKGLDLMPKITDTLFSLVIRHLKLSHLTLTSGDAVNSVTAGGIRSLLDGPVAESIEKFSFQEWSVANFSSDEYKLLEQEFRSYYML